MVCKVATIFAQIDITKFATIPCFFSVPLLHQMPFASLCTSCPHINTFMGDFICIFHCFSIWWSS